nr:hypothetical protein GCM10020093_016260 [Planobispora longispora]
MLAAAGARVCSSVRVTASTRSRSACGSTRRIFASALSVAVSPTASPVRRPASSPSTTAVASSSVNISGGSL